VAMECRILLRDTLRFLLVVLLIRYDNGNDLGDEEEEEDSIKGDDK